jgi:hypothetical protein
MAQKLITITLKQPILGHEVVREVKMRRPTGDEILTMGFPYTFQPTPDGGRLFIENNEAIKFYVEACIVEPKDKLALLTQIEMEDVLELREQVMGFFLEAQTARRTSPKSSTASSSTSDGSPQT